METFAHVDNGSMEAVSPVKGFVLEDIEAPRPAPRPSTENRNIGDYDVVHRQ
jgi:hypothetical protein